MYVIVAHVVVCGRVVFALRLFVVALHWFALLFVVLHVGVACCLRGDVV